MGKRYGKNDAQGVEVNTDVKTTLGMKNN